MKKTIYIFIFLVGMLLTVNVGNSYAQENQESKIHAGAGLFYGSGFGNGASTGLGINVNGYYSVTQNIRAGIGFIYYLGAPDNVTYWELNINGQYHFAANGEISPYLLAGLNFANASVDIGNTSVSNSETGLNLGGGFEYPVNFGAFFAEAKYIIGNADQFVIGAGVRFGF